MTTTRNSGPETTASVVVCIRIPHQSGHDLVTGAETRLSQADGVANAAVDGIRGLDPKLSATILTVETTIHLTGADIDLVEQLADVPGLETVKRIDDRLLEECSDWTPVT